MGLAVEGDRVAALDGLRGWAALCVVCYHLLTALYGLGYAQVSTPVLNILVNGQFAVFLFFAISGYVLTYASWRGSKAHVARQFVKRHSRLAVPVFFSSIIVYVLMVLDVPAYMEAVAAIGNEHWFRHQLTFEPTPLNLMLYSVWGVFTEIGGRVGYSPFLWTMPFELWGSFAVLALSLIERPRWLPYVVLIALSAVLMLVLGIAACFPIGALVALAHKDSLLPRLPDWVTLPGCAACFVVAGLYPVPDARFGPLPILAGLMLVLVVSGRSLTTVLSAPVSGFLGRGSFPLYLMQWPVLLAVTSPLMLWLANSGTLSLWTASAVALVSLAATVLAAWLFLPVERLTAWSGRQLVQLTLRPRPKA